MEWWVVFVVGCIVRLGESQRLVGAGLDSRWSIMGAINTVLGAGEDLASKVTSTSANAAIDALLQPLKISNGRMTLPNIDAAPYPGMSFQASGGYYGNLSSVTRAAPVNVTRQGASVTVQVPLTLRQLEVGYESYRINLPFGLGTSGKAGVSVGENRVALVAKLNPGPNCAVTLDRVEIQALSGISVQVTSDCTLCGFMTGQASSWLANAMSGTIKNNIQSTLDTAVRQLLKDNPLMCSKFLGI